MKKKILVIDDEEHILELLKINLEFSGYDTYAYDTGKDVLEIIEKTNPDLILLDLMLPEIDGIEICKRIRRNPKFNKIKLLILSAKSDEIDKILCLEIGADDYITKPFSVVILHKRIEALLRRIQGKENTNKWLYKDVEVDFLGFSAKKQGKTVDLKPKEIKLLELLLKYKNQVLTRSQMLDNLWDVEETPLDRVIDVYIKNIRKKLCIDCIITVKGIGYKFEEKL